MRHILRRLVAGGAACFVLLVAGSNGTADADETGVAAEQLMMSRTFPDLLKKCPADYAASAIVDAQIETEVCARDLTGCLKRCRLGDASKCLSAAYALQESSADQRSASSELAFAASCKLGVASGCTNRAAAIMSDGLPGFTLAKRDSCTFRSFRLSCDAGDAWGCTMLTLHYAEGTGVKIDGSAANAAASNACLIWPDSEPCASANAILKHYGFDR